MAKLYKHESVCVACGIHFTYTTGNPCKARRYCDKCQPHKYQTGECLIKVGVCQMCGNTFEYMKVHKSGYQRKFCDECTKQRKRTAAYNSRVRLGHIHNPGVGSGNAQGSGRDSKYYKDGSSTYRKDARAYFGPDGWKCFYCGATFSTSRKDPTKHMSLLVHHIDGDRTNNDPSNWRVVCKRCHQVVEHNCTRNLPNNP